MKCNNYYQINSLNEKKIIFRPKSAQSVVLISLNTEAKSPKNSFSQKICCKKRLKIVARCLIKLNLLKF